MGWRKPGEIGSAVLQREPIAYADRAAISVAMGRFCAAEASHRAWPLALPLPYSAGTCVGAAPGPSGMTGTMCGASSGKLG